MFTYSDGTGIEVGDSVLVEHGSRLYLPEWSLAEDPLVFVARAANTS
jgi:hypothetical protein